MKEYRFSRRDFLKAAALAGTAGLATFADLKTPFRVVDLKQSQNVLILLFDALSAQNISLYGYPRETMPNLARFADKSTVFHRHHSTGNFTVPATASLLGGVYPWSHRTWHLSGMLPDQQIQNNIFSVVPSAFTTFGYSHNDHVEGMMNQCDMLIDEHPATEEWDVYSTRVFTSEIDWVLTFEAEKMFRGYRSYFKSGYFLGSLIDFIENRALGVKIDSVRATRESRILRNYSGDFFSLPDNLQNLQKTIDQYTDPYLAYVHFYPPHSPFLPSKETENLFKDDWAPPDKPNHIFALGFSKEDLIEARLSYDRFIASTDAAIGDFLDNLEAAGYFENTNIIITSDHGNIYERGVAGHLTRVMYEPLLKIPLVIHKPGQTKREDVESLTSIVDILPTICQITGQPIPDWADGEVLPTFNSSPVDQDRAIFSLEAKENSKFKALTIGTMVLYQGAYKLIHYFGYEALAEGWELYNLENDPEERDDLFQQEPVIADRMKNKLLSKLEEANQPYL